MIASDRSNTRGAGWLPAWVAVVVVALTFANGVTAARADNIDVLVKDVKSGGDYKVRLSAVLALAKLGDKRGLPALLGGLSDSDKTVRGAAAVAIGKLVSAATPATTRTQIKAAIETLLKRETTESVKKLANKTLQQLEALDSAAVTAGGIYIEVAPMASKAEPAAAIKALMRKTAAAMLTKKANDFIQAWPGGKSPTRKDLDKKSVSGFYLDGTVNEVTVKQKGATATVSCKINMLIASFPEKSIFGMLTGTASVAGSSEPSDIELAKQDCVAAVVEDLVATKVVPTIRKKATP
jgi:HEAT repeats